MKTERLADGDAILRQLPDYRRSPDLQLYAIRVSARLSLCLPAQHSLIAAGSYTVAFANTLS